MHNVLGFTVKTAEKLINSLKGRLPEHTGNTGKTMRSSAYMEAMNALSALGYRPGEARNALEDVYSETGPEANTADLIRLALKKIANRAH